MSKENKILTLNTHRGYLDFKIGERYKAIGTCGIDKDITIEGLLIREDNEFYLKSDRGYMSSINFRTLDYI